MDTSRLKRFAQFARRNLIEQVTARADVVLTEGSLESREHPNATEELKSEVSQYGKSEVIERAAYIWFNRFCALRYMDLNDLHQARVVSPIVGQFQPEILIDAKAGNFNGDIISEKIRKKTIELLDRQTSSFDAQSEAYRLLLVEVCNYWHKTMPFLFQEINSFTELLLPNDLLSQASILAYIRESMTPDVCRNVEVMGWLYQFYISEKKDQVFAALKKNQKVTAENIPAATQMFTPHWIVRYLVENSLGRLWLLNRPQSCLAEKMEFYLKPSSSETDFLQIDSPEEIRICDPAVGSGHMLTYAFDLLFKIYEEEGYDSTDIPSLILSNNLTGIEIDERAGSLAAFALSMKAAEKLGRRRFLSKKPIPNICVLQNVGFSEGELQNVYEQLGEHSFAADLLKTLQQFENAKTFGSLIVPEIYNPITALNVVEKIESHFDLLLKELKDRIILVLRMAEVLSANYNIVVSNPPYMSWRSMNKSLKKFLQQNFSEVKSDLFSAFIMRNSIISLPKAQLGFMTPFVWMFISSFKKLRRYLLKKKTLVSLVQLEYSGFEGATVPICIFLLENFKHQNFECNYIRLSDFRGSEQQAPKTLEAIKNSDCGWRFNARSDDFQMIPEVPIAYWISEKLRQSFLNQRLDDFAPCRQGIATGNNDKFLRLWHEIDLNRLAIGFTDAEQAKMSRKKWFTYNKGGNFRKWYGNNDYVINWHNNGQELKAYKPKSIIRNEKFFFRSSLTWTFVSSAFFGIRYSPPGSLFDVGGSSVFPPNGYEFETLGFLVSRVATEQLSTLNPTLNFQVGNISNLGLIDLTTLSKEIKLIVKQAVEISEADWNAYETSLDFTRLPLLAVRNLDEKLESIYAQLRENWQDLTLELQKLEEKNNRIFIDAYNLEDELSQKVPIHEVTLTCNPAYSYGSKVLEADQECRLRTDTVAELVSYAVGCMFGRYSLDKPGLILANQGDQLRTYLEDIPYPSFQPDEDNIIPVLNRDWFFDDVTERFRKFLRVSFGENHFQENLNFIENALGKNIRQYFIRDFYKDHIKRYKKRPIYWMFASPNGTFQALIYLHRYQIDTVSVLLNDYLREFISKLEGERKLLEQQSNDSSLTHGQRTKAFNAMGRAINQIDELKRWEREVIFPLAQEKIAIDLDDGVKVNYPKFGSALKKIAGLN